MLLRSETTIDTDKYQYYMVTIVANQKKDYISKYRLDEVIGYLKYTIDEMHVKHYVYENSGKYKQLHWHSIVLLPESFRYAQYTRWGSKEHTGNSYRIRWDKVYNLLGAIDYINKDLLHQTQEEIIINNYYNHHYGFDL